MPLSSSSSFDEVKAEYLECAGYDLAGSNELARRFIVACRILLVMLPKRARQGSAQELESELALYQKEIDNARRWLAAHSSLAPARTAFVDFRNFRC